MFELKLSKVLDWLAVRFRQKALYFKLKSFIKQKKHFLEQAYPHHRGIGKTHTLVELAHKYNAPIIVPGEEFGRNIKNISMKMYGKPARVISAESVVGMNFDVVLIEDGVDVDTFFMVTNHSKCAVGFQRMYPCK